MGMTMETTKKMTFPTRNKLLIVIWGPGILINPHVCTCMLRLKCHSGLSFAYQATGNPFGAYMCTCPWVISHSWVELFHKEGLLDAVRICLGGRKKGPETFLGGERLQVGCFLLGTGSFLA